MTQKRYITIDMDVITLGQPRYYVPVCVRTPLGFTGGPSWYHEVPEGDADRGPIIVSSNKQNKQDADA